MEPIPCVCGHDLSKHKQSFYSPCLEDDCDCADFEIDEHEHDHKHEHDHDHDHDQEVNR